MRRVILSGCILCTLSLSGAHWCEDFGASLRSWQVNATQFLVPKTRFFARRLPNVRGGAVLVVSCRKSTGAFIRPLIGCIDLEATPLLHWRWRVRSLPGGGDGRNFRTDDQPIAIYLVAGGPLARRGIAYRWESETPLEYVGDLRYTSTMQIRFCCLRNKTSPKNEWVEETRNVRNDFMNAFGYVPKDFAISVCGNSQHTASNTDAELDFIEFLPQPKKIAGKHAEPESETSALGWIAVPEGFPRFRLLPGQNQFTEFQEKPKKKSEALPVPFKEKVTK